MSKDDFSLNWKLTEQMTLINQRSVHEKNNSLSNFHCDDYKNVFSNVKQVKSPDWHFINFCVMMVPLKS